MRFLSAAVLVAMWIGSTAHAQGPDDTAECYDAVVKGRIVEQTPSVFPESDDGSITLVWPWFLKLHVRKVVVGTAPTGPLLVLSMQHTSFLNDLGWRRWWLRRNSLGGFNLLRFGEAENLPRCLAGGEVAEALIRPGPNQTLDGLLEDGKRAYRHLP
jgi:hypothetical protein